jgi:hypothetical protein
MGCRSVLALLRVNGVGGMDPITLIVTALAAGATLGAQDTVSAMMKDAYAGLKARVKKRLSGRPGPELLLARHEQAPETWRAPLIAELAETGADGDRDLITAAQALLDLVGDAQGRAGKHTVDVRGGPGGADRVSQPAGQRVQCPGGRLGMQMTAAAGPGNCARKLNTAGRISTATSEITVFSGRCVKRQRVQEMPTCAGGRFR